MGGGGEDERVSYIAATAMLMLFQIFLELLLLQAAAGEEERRPPPGRRPSAYPSISFFATVHSKLQSVAWQEGCHLKSGKIARLSKKAAYPNWFVVD